jgi:anaerobic magnesium-protoporphyrin IX monomethyl ester cyclase
MTDILFGQSYYLRFDPKLWEAMRPYPPLGTLYAASYMRSRGYDVALFDAMLAHSEAEWDAALERCHPPLAVLYEDNFNYLSKMCLLRMRQAAHIMIKAARQRGCVVIVAGSDASDHPESYLSQGADYVLLGEGEATLGELADHLFGRSDQALSTILGLAYAQPARYPAFRRDPQPQVRSTPLPGENSPGMICNPRRPDLQRLDELPFPAWDLVDVERYRAIWLKRHGYFSLNMATTRGCPFHCNWCAKPIWGQRYNSRSPENVAAELKWLVDRYAPDHIWFVDDIFGLRPGWVARFAQAVEACGARTPFKSLNRVDLLLREGEIEALRRAGCQWVWVGAESGSQKILDAMDKGTRVGQIYAATRALHAAGIKVGFFLQFGYPGEAMEDIHRTFQMVRECQPDDIGMSVSYPLPGTPFHEMVRERLGAQRNWYDSNDLAMLYQGPFSTAFYRQLHRLLHVEFRRMRAWRNLLKGGSKSARYYLPRWLLETARLPFERLRLFAFRRQSQPENSWLPARMRPEEAARPTGGPIQ